MRSSCWHGDRLDLVEITAEEEDWWGMEFPTTSSSCPDQVASPYDHGFEVLAKSSSSKPSFGGQGSALFSCFRHSPGLLMVGGDVCQTESDLEPNTPPGSEVLLVQASRSRLANGNITEFVAVDEATENSRRIYSGYESDRQPHMHSDEEPTSPVVNCIGQVRPKKKPKHVAKRSEPGAERNNKGLVLESLAKLHSLQLASPRRSGDASQVLPEVGAAKCKSTGKWKQMLQLAPAPQATRI